jgi:hypothetical protein
MYKSHFACFRCRKTFKQAHYADLLKKIGKAGYFQKLMHKSMDKFSDKERVQFEEFDKNFMSREIKCPQCGGYMVDLGLDFRSPKQTAVKEWRIIEGLYTIGKSFYSCGCDGPGYIPNNPKDYEAYLNKVLHDYESNITSFQNQPLKECRDKSKRIAYWSERVAVVKEELALYKDARQ